MADDDREILQHLIDKLFEKQTHVSRLDALIQAEAFDFDEELLSLIELLPPITYTRQQIADQLNSVLTAHGWNQRFGTVE